MAYKLLRLPRPVVSNLRLITETFLGKQVNVFDDSLAIAGHVRFCLSRENEPL